MRKIKKIGCLLLMAAMLCTFAVPAAAMVGDAQNLYQHGDFEEGLLDEREGRWSYAYFNKEVVDLTTLESEDSNLKSRGGKVLKLERNTDNTSRNSDMYYNYAEDFIANHKYLLRFYYFSPVDTAVYGKCFSSNISLSGSGTGEWTLFERVYEYTDGAEKVVYPIRVSSARSMGETVYIDDLMFVDLTKAAFDGNMNTNDKWTVEGIAPIEEEGAFEGAGMMKLDGKATVSQLAYMGTTAGDYMFKGLVKTGEGYQSGDAEIRLYAGVKDAGEAPVFTKALDAAAVWTEVLADNLIADATNVITVEIENTGDACVYLDAFTLGASTNLVVNGGFERENPTEGVTWSSGAITDEDAKSGDYSFKATYAGKTATPQIKRMPCKPNTKYTVTYSLKGTATCGYSVTTFEGETSLGENPKLNGLGDAYRTGNWETVSFSFTTGETVTHMTLTFSIRAAGTYYFDDVSIYEEYPHETAFRNADGEGIYEIYEGMPVGFTAKYAWTAENEGTCLFAVVLYKEVNGVKNLEKVFLENCTYTAGDTLLSQDIELGAVTMEDGAAYTMKCMVWDNMTTLNPAEKVYSIRSY